MFYGAKGFARYFPTKRRNLFRIEGIKKHYEMVPLLILQTCAFFAMPFWSYHRMFLTTIDVQLTEYQRFEIPSKPRFFDLRNPRSMKLITFGKEWKPAIHLDNRYRLMRHEPMLDAYGNVTDKIGSEY
ncbi:PREDICTED: uncharacterized protein LOC105451640 [Wasmannia auropunctata]|uniref:uncharacterized protein LOC105451640 n=1 Tax=Wasmannia auropunctata TaxID=64793 RepID=UPI0005EE7DA7|nr:PREDICTED: uncharacterized protein LOC105451640 [Wasmannia auropunctata]